MSDDVKTGVADVTPVVAPAATPAPAPVVQAAPVAPALRELSDDDEDVPEGLFKISPKALSSRVQRGAEKKLKEHGLQSWEEIEAMKARLQEYESKQEEARLAQLTEAERERALREKAETRLQEMQAEVANERTNRMMEREENRVTSWLNQYIEPKFAKYAMGDVLDAINEASEADIANPDEFLKAYFERYVAEEQPGFARAAFKAAPVPEDVQQQQAPAPVAPAPEPRAIPMTNGLQLTRPLPNAQQTMQGKTAAPGRPNSMTAAELIAYKKSLGLTY
jgi:hypothetical protein